jgi:hypothetical protein
MFSLFCKNIYVVFGWRSAKLNDCENMIQSSHSACLGTKARVLSFNRMQSRIVTGLLTGHNTLRRHLYLMGLSDSPLCRKCGVEGETSAHILCGCKALASLRHVYLGCFFLGPENVKNISLRAKCNFWHSDRTPINCNGAHRAR